MKAHAMAAVCLFATALAVSPAWAAVPDQPEDVRKDRIGDTSVRITWDDVSGEDGYEILRKESFELDSAYELRGTVGENVTSFVDNDAPRGPVFIYRVRAFNEDGDSDLSNECFVNRPKPTTPGSFRAVLIALTTVKLSWDDMAAGERGFQIQRAEPGERFRTIATVPSNTQEYIDDTLIHATDYLYRVRPLGRPAICWDNGNFTPERFITTAGERRTLRVDLRGSGAGRVRSTPAGIDCTLSDDDGCEVEFPWNIIVTIEAFPNRSSKFVGWEDFNLCDGDEAKQPCTFNMLNDVDVGARFKRKD